MLGTIVNALAIIGGSIVGLLFRKGIPERFSDTVTDAVGLSVVLIGIKGAMKSDDLLLVILSLVIGAIIGEALQVEMWLERIGRVIESRFEKGGDGSLTKGFVTASLLYCVGAMAIIGSLESGLAGNHQTLFAKSVLDGTISVVLASALGIGVMFSALSVFLYQGLITLSASVIKPYLVPEVVAQISSVGGLMIVAIGLNLLHAVRIRIGNLLPGIFIPLIYYVICQVWASSP